jgi:hypothetical protein
MDRGRSCEAGAETEINNPLYLLTIRIFVYCALNAVCCATAGPVNGCRRVGQGHGVLDEKPVGGAGADPAAAARMVQAACIWAWACIIGTRVHHWHEGRPAACSTAAPFTLTGRLGPHAETVIPPIPNAAVIARRQRISAGRAAVAVPSVAGLIRGGAGCYQISRSARMMLPPMTAWMSVSL